MADELGQLLGYEDAPKPPPVTTTATPPNPASAAPGDDLGALLGYGPTPSQTLPTPEQVDQHTTQVAQVTADAITRPQGPTIGALPSPGILERIRGAILGDVRTGDTALGRVTGNAVETANNPESKENAPFFRYEAEVPENTPLRGAAEFATGMVRPEQAEFAALGGVPGILGRLISAGFSAQMVYGSYNDAIKNPEFINALKSGDLKTASRIATKTALELAAAFFAGRHAMKGEPKPAAATHSEAPTSPIDLRGAKPAETATTTATPPHPATEAGPELGQILYPEEKTNETNTEEPATPEAKPEGGENPPGRTDAGAQPGERGPVEAEEPGNDARQLLGFETSKGSRYTLSGKGTSRSKTATGEEFGASHRTVYITPEIQKSVMEDLQAGNVGDTKAAIRQGKNGKIAVVVKDRATGNARGAYAFPFTEEPELGLHPVELWHKDPKTGEYGFHVGHAITRLIHEGEDNAANNGNHRGTGESAPVRTDDERSGSAPSTEAGNGSGVEGGLPRPVGSEPRASEPEPHRGDQGADSGRVEFPENEYFRGVWNIPLNDVGRAQAKQAAEANAGRFDRIVSAALDRHMETAQAFRKTSPKAEYGVNPNLDPMALGKLEGEKVTPESLEEHGRRMRGALAEIPGKGQFSGRPGESSGRWTGRLIRAVQNEIDDWKPGKRFLLITSGRDIQAVRAWAAEGMPSNRMLDFDKLAQPWDTKPGGMMRLDPRTGGIEDVATADKDGIYFARHGETDANDNPAIPGQVRAKQEAEGTTASTTAADEENGPHGPVSRQYAGKPREALAWVRAKKTGFAEGAIPHEIGDIGLPYGVEGDPEKDYRGGYGVAHIDAKHPGWLDENVGKISGWSVQHEFPDSDGRIHAMLLSDGEGNRALVSRDWMGKPHPEWLLTGYERSAPTASIGVRETPEGAAPTPAATDRSDSSVESGGKPPQGEAYRAPAAPRELPTRPAYGREGVIRVAGEPTTYRFRYALIEADEAIASHMPHSFEPNPDYEPDNERDYSKAENSSRVVERSAPETFDPEFITTESPTAEHGPPVPDQRWNMLGANNRTLMAQRVYARGDLAAERLRAREREAALRAGVPQEEVERFERPLLTRQLIDPLDAEGTRRAIRDFNKTSAAALSPSERAVADGRRLSAKTVEMIAARIEDAGADGTLAQAIRGDNGPELINALVSDGVLTTQEKNGLVDERGALTPEAKDRISKMLVGRLFDSPKELEATPPEMRGKLERIAPHVMRVESNPEWNLTPVVREALDAIAEARGHGGRNLDDLVNQRGLMTGETREYSPDAIALGKLLQKKPTEVEKAFRRYANDEKLAREGGTIFAPATREEAFADAFTPNGERGSISTELATLGVHRFIKNDVQPLVRSVAVGVMRAADDILKVLAPTLRGGPRVETGKLSMRGRLGEMARRGDQARAALRAAERFFNRQEKDFNYEFWDRIENGEQQATPELDQIAKVLRELLDGRRADVQALGNGKLRAFYENYMPRAWKDQRTAAQAIRDFYARRPFEGGKSFLKRRTYPTMADGRAAGLEPVTDNPVTMALLKIHEMDRYIAAHRTLNDWKAQRSAIFVDARKTEIQQRMRRRGWVPIADPIGTVYGPSVQPITEYPNEGLWSGLGKVADALGLKHERGFIRRLTARGAVGVAHQGKGLVETLHGSAEDVLAHEIGHQIDWLAGSGRKFVIDYPDAETVARIKRARATLKDTKGTSVEQRRAARKELESLKAAIQDRKEFAKQLRDLADLRGGRKAYTHKREEKMALLAELWASNQPLFERTAPKVFRLWKQFLGENPKLHALRDLEANTEVSPIAQNYDVGGLVIKGHWWAPEPLARLMDNHLMPGLMQKPVFRGLMGVNNALNLFNLGLSGFHVGKTALESSISKGALAWEAAFRGHPVEALKHAAGVPVAPFTAAIRGDRMLREWYTPGSQGAEIGRLADLATSAGARARMDEAYRTRTAAAMTRALRDGNLIGAGLRAPFAAMESMTNLIMDQVVPRLKMGVFADMAAAHLKQMGPDPEPVDVRRAMANDWNSVENRLGEVTRDNLFWNRYARDLGVMLMRADQWTLGTVRELGGAVGDLVAQPLRAKAGKPVNLNRLTYAASMISLHMAYSGLYQYLHTGQAPQDPEDWFFPKNGQTDELGRPQRSVLPSYVKDIYEFARHPVRTAENKAAAGITLASELIRNEQFDRSEIHHPGDPAGKQLADTGKFVAQQFEPFSVRNFRRERELGTPPGAAAEQFVGINPAPSDLDDGPGARLARDLAGAEEKPRTQDEAERAHLRQELTRSLRMQRGAPAEVVEARQSGKLSQADVARAIRAARETPLERTYNALGIEDALRVYRAADAGERTQIRAMLLKKGRAALRNAPPASRGHLAGELRDALR